MKKRSSPESYAKWISLLLLVCLICACGTLEVKIEGVDPSQDNTPTQAPSSQPSSYIKTPRPSSTPSATRMVTTTPSGTPLPIPTSSTPPVPIPHFPPGEIVTITFIDMVNATIGWGIGRDEETSTDHILTTSDGGNTWRDVTPSELTLQKTNEFQYKHASAFFLDEQRAIVIYDPEEIGDPARIWSTSSAGSQWDMLTISTVFQTVVDLAFIDDSHAWLMLGIEAAMGHAWIELYQINVDSQQWELYIDPNDKNSADLHYCCKSSMIFANSVTGIVTFYRGPMGGAFVNWTDNGGLTWERRSLPRPPGYFTGYGDSDYGFLCDTHSPNLFSPQNGKVAMECWIDLDASDLVSFIFTTLDGGISWQSALYPGGEILFLDPQVGWALSKDIYQTLDGGKTWTKMSTVTWEGQFSFVSQQLGWAAVQKGEEQALVQTLDGGKIWYLIEPVTSE